MVTLPESECCMVMFRAISVGSLLRLAILFTSSIEFLQEDNNTTKIQKEWRQDILKLIVFAFFEPEVIDGNPDVNSSQTLANTNLSQTASFSQFKADIYNGRWRKPGWWW